MDTCALHPGLFIVHDLSTKGPRGWMAPCKGKPLESGTSQII